MADKLPTETAAQEILQRLDRIEQMLAKLSMLSAGPEISLVEETRAAMANGMDPLAFLKSRQNVARKPRRKSA